MHYIFSYKILILRAQTILIYIFPQIMQPNEGEFCCGQWKVEKGNLLIKGTSNHYQESQIIHNCFSRFMKRQYQRSFKKKLDGFSVRGIHLFLILCWCFAFVWNYIIFPLNHDGYNIEVFIIRGKNPTLRNSTSGKTCRKMGQVD